MAKSGSLRELPEPVFGRISIENRMAETAGHCHGIPSTVRSGSGDVLDTVVKVRLVPLGVADSGKLRTNVRDLLSLYPGVSSGAVRQVEAASESNAVSNQQLRRYGGIRHDDHV